MRGYNDSSKPEAIESYKVQCFVNDLKEVINKLGNGKAYLVGDGIGALFCWLLAEEEPDLIRRLIILNCPVPRAYLHLVCTNSKQLIAAWLEKIVDFKKFCVFLGIGLLFKHPTWEK